MPEENPRLVKEIKNSAIPIEFETFCGALKWGGEIIFENEFQKDENGDYFHALRYKGDLYVTTTDYFVKEFLV